MIYYHEWLGTTEDYDELFEDIPTHIKPVPSINWKVEFIKVFDDNEGEWVTVRPGEYVCQDSAGKVWVERG